MFTKQLTQAGHAHRTGRTIVSSFAGAMMLAAAALLAGEAHAEDDFVPHPFKSASISFVAPDGPGRGAGPTIIVTHNGATYTRVAGDIEARFNVKAEVKVNHRIYGFVVVMSDPNYEDKFKQTLPGPRAYGVAYDRSIDRHRTLKMSAADAVNFGTPGISLGLSPELQLVARCNAKHSSPPEVDEFLDQVELEVHAGVSSGPYKAHYVRTDFGWTPEEATDATATVSTTFTASVFCQGPPFRSAEIPPKIVEASLGVTTSGNTCPKPAKARVIIATEAPRTVFYKIRRGPAYTTSDWIQGETKEVPNLVGTGKSAVLDATHELGKVDPGYTNYRLVIQGWDTTPETRLNVDCPPFEVISTWLKYDVEAKATCPKKVVETATFHTTRPGDVPYEIKHEGGLVVSQGTVEAKRQGDQYVATAVRNLTIGEFDGRFMADVKNSPANSGWERLEIDCLEALSGKVTLKSMGAASCKGEALVAIHTDGAGELPYELECGPGKSWQRNVKAMSNKIGVDKVQFDVTNNEQVTCVLRTRIGGKLKPLGGASRTFQCVKTTGLDGSSDLAPKPRPDAQKPDKPGKLVIDPPRKPEASKPDKDSVSKLKIACANGTVKNGACSCARTDRKVKAGKNAWRCVRVVVDPPRKKEGAKVGVKTAPKKTAVPKPAITSKGKRYKERRETAKKANVSAVAR